MNIGATYGLVQAGLFVLIIGAILSWVCTNGLRSLLARPYLDLGTGELRRQANPRYLKHFLFFGVVFLLFPLFLLYQHVSNPIQPPSTATVQQEFNRKDKHALDASWKTYALKAIDGWQDSGFDFSADDYFWVISFDSCFIKVQSLVDDSVKVVKIAIQAHQARLTKPAAIYLKTPVAKPPLYNGLARNVFLKRWSFNDQLSSRKFSVYSAFLLLGTASFLLSFVLFGYKEQPAKAHPKTTSVSTTTQSSPAQPDRETYPLVDIAHLTKVITTELTQAYKENRTHNVVKQYWHLLEDFNFRKQVEAKMHDLDAVKALRDSIRELQTSDLKDKKAEAGLEADIAEDEVRKARAESEKRKFEQPNREKECLKIKTRYQGRLSKISFDNYKEYLQTDQPKEHRQAFIQEAIKDTKTIDGFLDQLIEIGITPRELEAIIQDILQEDKKSAADKTAEATQEAADELRSQEEVILKEIKTRRKQEAGFEKEIFETNQELETQPNDFALKEKLRQLTDDLEYVQNKIQTLKQKLKSM